MAGRASAYCSEKGRGIQTVQMWRAVTIFAAASVAACSDTGSHAIEVRFEPETLRAQADRVEVGLVGSCSEVVLGEPVTDPLELVVIRKDGRRTGSLGSVPPGQYGLYARAWSTSDCSVRAAVCEPVRLEAAGGAATVLTVSPVEASGETIDIALGYGFSCAGTKQGSIWCWGDGSYGALGNGELLGAIEPSPQRVGTASDWERLAAGERHVCGIRLGGDLFCWGENSRGELGIGNTNLRAAPTQVSTGTEWAVVRAEGHHTCAFDAGGTLWCWGDDEFGELGIGRPEARQETPVAVPGGWQAVALGRWHTCAIASDDSLWCWGRNDHGQLGQGNGGAATSVSTPAPVQAGSRWAQVTGGESHTCGIQQDGTLWCWGRNSDRQLGVGSSSELIPAPMQVLAPDPTGWLSVQAGEDHTCARRGDGSVWCWGENDHGQVGIGASAILTDQASPARVGEEEDWTQLGAGQDQTCGSRGGAGLWCWGDGTLGQLGLGSLGDRPQPVQACL